ncbi:hypothetical protein SDC9_41316 [bioreactor metagenome]|uniref:Uncharacterized protein n=1 Tax=bioreactor metagenome TaxID=1076179 RepID=A0A644VV97_9ZZZZ
MIKSSIKKVTKSCYFPMLILSISMWLILLRVGLKDGSDDTAHLAYLSQFGVIKWLYNRIVTWQPRIFSDLTYAMLINNLSAWRIINSTLLSILMISISKLSTEGKEGLTDNYKLSVSTFACCLFYFISPYVITSGMIWYTGSFYYLWPVTAMMISIIPFYYAVSGSTTKYKNLNIVFYITTICSCYNEQTLAIIFCFSSICFGYLRFSNRKISKTLIIQYILIIVNGIIFYALSQIADRIVMEVFWYTGFDMLSLIDKLFQGVNWTNYHYINSSNLLMLIVTIELFILIRKKKFEIKTISMIPLIFFLLRVIPLNTIFSSFNINNIDTQVYTGSISPYSFEELLYNYFYNTTKVMSSNMLSGSIIDFLPSFSGFFIMLFITVLLWIALRKKEDKILMVSLYLAALASGYVVGFSPTIFASRSRIFFVGNILVLLIAVKLFCEILSYENVHFPRWINYIFVGLAALIWFQFLSQFVTGILWL